MMHPKVWNLWRNEVIVNHTRLALNKACSTHEYSGTETIIAILSVDTAMETEENTNVRWKNSRNEAEKEVEVGAESAQRQMTM